MPTISIENRPDGVTVIVMDRPEKRNAISSGMAVELQQAFADFEQGGQKVAVLTGRGNEAFTGGADVRDLPEFWRVVEGVGIHTTKPVIAAMAGWCVGGGMVMAMMADLAVAAENTRFSYPEARLGFTGGMIAGLAARIPHKVAMEVMLLGRTLDARRAYEVGMVNEVVPVGRQVERAIELAAELAESAPLVLASLKQYVNGGVLPASPAERMMRTTLMVRKVEDSADKAEGLNAFLEKRKPRYTGR